MRIALGSDHAGYRYKELFKAALAQAGHDVTDHGVFSLGVTADSSTIVTAESDYVCNIWVAKLGASMASVLAAAQRRQRAVPGAARDG